MTDMNPVLTEANYEEALVRVESLMDAVMGTPEGDELHVLSTLIAAYEEKAFPMDVPDAVTAIRFVMDQKGLQQSDFAALIGKSRASEVLNEKRDLSMNQARKLCKDWGVPADSLLSA